FTSEVVPMAGLRKPGKRDGNNTVLVIFLAFFVLLSIGLGVWGYFGYSGQKELREKAKEKEVLAQANKIGEQYAMTVAREAALAYGLTVSADDQTLHKNSIDDVLEDKGDYAKQDAKVREASKTWITEMRKALDYDKEGKKYKESFKEKVDTLSKNLTDARGQVEKCQSDFKSLNDRYEKVAATINQQWKDAESSIKKGNLDALKAAQ